MMNMVNKETAIKDYLAMIKQRWTILDAIYHAFLLGCGYRNRVDWRD